MPQIYGVGAGGRVHRETQPEYVPKSRKPRREPSWAKCAVVVGGVEYSTGAAADRAMGWRSGATKQALRQGRTSYGGKPIAYLGEAS